MAPSMSSKKLDNQGRSNRFKTDELILVSTPILLTLIAIILVLVAPKILHYHEVDRCHEIKGTFDDEKDECVVTGKELLG
jgi:hypothetical protein